MKVYTLLDVDDDNSIISSGLIWDEVIALVDYLNLENWDVIEYDCD